MNSPDKIRWLLFLCLCAFFNCCCSVPVGQGYGLTETCAGAAFSEWDDTSVGRVGPPLPCCYVKVSVYGFDETCTKKSWLRDSSFSGGVLLGIFFWIHLMSCRAYNFIFFQWHVQTFPTEYLPQPLPNEYTEHLHFSWKTFCSFTICNLFSWSNKCSLCHGKKVVIRFLILRCREERLWLVGTA